jgi:signal transduction histidine kinase
MAAIPLEVRRRARFEALRRSIFAEMGQAQARMRLAMVAPFQALVLALFALRGLPTGRLGIQAGVFVATCALYGLAPKGGKSLKHMSLGLLTFVVGIANTGGLASPLVPLALPLLAGASVTLPSPAPRTIFFALCGFCFTALALLSHTVVGDLPPPLTPLDGHPSPEYLVLVFASLGFLVVTVSRFGSYVSSAYERVAIELATRREELCTEGADRSRTFEGVAARLAHEVKNPLAAIKGLSAHMARNATDPKSAERLSIVAAEADRLQSIVDSYLSFSRGWGELDVGETHPYDIARELTLLLETRAEDAGVSLEVLGNSEVELNADARKLRQALLNFVLNAMQASSSGQKVTVEVGPACPADGFLRMKVIDRGAGMSKDALERVGKPYFTTREGGTGLGVAVARGIVEQHGGHVSFESAPGKGTTVLIDLPRCALRAKGAQKLLPKPRCAAFEALESVTSAPGMLGDTANPPEPEGADAPPATAAEGTAPAR